MDVYLKDSRVDVGYVNNLPSLVCGRALHEREIGIVIEKSFWCTMELFNNKSFHTSLILSFGQNDFLLHEIFE